MAAMFAEDNQQTPNEEESKKSRTEVVKKARRSISPPGAKRHPRTPSPPLPPEKNLRYEDHTTMISSPPSTPVETLDDISSNLDVPPMDISLPDLPDWKNKDSPTKTEKQKLFMNIPSTPTIDESEKRKAPPRTRKKFKVPIARLRTTPGVAKVTDDQVKVMEDPLDWLAQYCIINPDRLPLYEFVFEDIVSNQSPRYEKPNLQLSNNAGTQSKSCYADHCHIPELLKTSNEMKDFSDSIENSRMKQLSLSILDKSLFNQKAGFSLCEQHLEKLTYTIQCLCDKLREMTFNLKLLEEKRTLSIATKATELYPEVMSRHYVPVLSKTRKGKRSSRFTQIGPNVEQIDDDVIISRLDLKRLSVLHEEPVIHQLDIEIERWKEKIKEVNTRLEHLASEKLLIELFCMHSFFERQSVENKSEEFRRRQSDLHNQLHPNPNLEMNVEELMDALQMINNHLLSEKECFFLYNILQLPGRTSINFRLFTVVAALSEKVTNLDPVVRKLMNNSDYNALDIKMEKCKDLFQFLQENDIVPLGHATVDSLVVELMAGGITSEHVGIVMNKFNRDNTGLIDFLEFVTYIPLFILVHKHIISHPLDDQRKT